MSIKKGVESMDNLWIYFDMDGTIADLYSVEGWLDYLRAEDPAPYYMAATMPHIDMCELCEKLNNLQRLGVKLGIISWSSKTASKRFDDKVYLAKQVWLYHHMNSIKWDSFEVVPYGTPKYTLAKEGISFLFDDEEKNRDEWNKKEDKFAFTEKDIMTILDWIEKGI